MRKTPQGSIYKRSKLNVSFDDRNLGYPPTRPRGKSSYVRKVSKLEDSAGCLDTILLVIEYYE